MRTSNYCLAIALAAALAGCATRYAPRSIWNVGGYAETRLAVDTYRVRFDGNEHMLPGQSADFAKLRAAELCLSGHKAFMRLGQFSTDQVYMPPRGRFETRPKDASSDTSGRNEAIEKLKRTVYIPGRVQYREDNYLTVTCVDEGSADAVNAATLAGAIRSQYRLEGA